MSSLFPVKAGAIAAQLRLIPETLAARRHERMAIGILEDTDSHYRIVLSSPSLVRAIREAIQTKDFRLRLCIPKVVSGASGLEMCLNIYNVDGVLLRNEHVSELSPLISLAVEAELQSILLDSKGITINEY